MYFHVSLGMLYAEFAEKKGISVFAVLSEQYVSSWPIQVPLICVHTHASGRTSLTFC